MIKYRVNEKRVLSLVNDEAIYYGENDITKIRIILPEKIDEYNKSDCIFELVAELELGWRITYQLDVDNPEISITTDITEKVQTVDYRVVIKNKTDGSVIGKTNTISKKILPTKEQYNDLDSRSELDKIILDLRGEVSELTTEKEALEVDNEAKRQTIIEKDNEIGVLNTQNEALSNEVTRLNNQVAPLTAAINNLNLQVTTQQQIVDEKNSKITALNSEISILTDRNTYLENQYEADQATISELNTQLASPRLVNIDITLDSLEIFDTIEATVPVSGSVYINGCIRESDKQRIETKFPNLRVSAEYVIDFPNFLVDALGSVVVDSDDNVLCFLSGGEYHSEYTANDINNFIKFVQEST